MIYISPSILSADFANLERDIKLVENNGADWIHVDVMDGHFVPNITIGVPVVASIRKVTKLPLDVHLMIENPEKYVEAFAKAGANILTFHYECGLSIKPKTSPEVILPYLNDLDLVLVMTVEPGFGGQKFMQDCAEKISVIKANAPENVVIQVDGGINAETARICTSYGANSLVAGSYIYKSADVKSAIASLH